jgi:hypothetical protein
MAASVSHTNAAVAFSFYKNSVFSKKDLRIGAFNTEKDSFAVTFTDNETLSFNTWFCPRTYLKTYLMDFFHFIYEDGIKRPDGFQIDCKMMPSIIVPLQKNDHKVLKILETVCRMLEMFVVHEEPTPSSDI